MRHHINNLTHPRRNTGSQQVLTRHRRILHHIVQHARHTTHVRIQPAHPRQRRSQPRHPHTMIHIRATGIQLTRMRIRGNRQRRIHTKNVHNHTVPNNPPATTRQQQRRAPVTHTRNRGPYAANDATRLVSRTRPLVINNETSQQRQRLLMTIEMMATKNQLTSIKRHTQRRLRRTPVTPVLLRQRNRHNRRKNRSDSHNDHLSAAHGD